MGVASYRRGSRLVSRQLERTGAQQHFADMDDLTRYSARHDGDFWITTYQTIARADERGWFWLMRDPDPAGGWNSFGYYYPSLWRLAACNKAVFLDRQQDSCSPYYRLIVLAEADRHQHEFFLAAQ